MLHLEPKHNIDEYLSLLQKNKTISINYQELVDAISNANYSIQDYDNLATMYLKIFSGGDYRNLSTDELIDFLIDKGINQKRFEVRGRKSLSFDMEKVVKPLINSGVYPEILEPYITMRKYVTYRNYLTKQLLNNPKVKYNRRNDGVLLCNYSFNIAERENLRVYYSDIAVVNIPKIYSYIITVPNTDYFLVWCDYPQADWRLAYNLFLRNEDNASVMDNYEDAYKGAAALVEGSEFSENDFEARRKLYKTDVLKTFYNSKDSSSLTSKLRDFFMQCPKYNKYYNDLAALYSLKIPIPCCSYFGYTQMIPEGNYIDAFIAKGMNTPIQTMTSHLVIETVFGVLDKFKSLGYDEEDIYPYFIRHDEPVFIAHKRILKDAWVFGDCSEIHIDGFSPIKLNFLFGYDYTITDDYITNIVSKSCSDNKHKFVQYPKGEMNNKWNPIPNVFSGYTDVIIRNGIPFVAFYLETGSIFKVYQVSTKIFEDAIIAGVKYFISDNASTKYLILDNISLSKIYKEEECLVYIQDNYDQATIDIIKDLFNNMWEEGLIGDKARTAIV